ncbi:MAG: hypothetical protein CL670_06590 [Balneola sp.]|jgi:hypothetical protein|nr:hypothetical protein [Balneola sp.]
MPEIWVILFLAFALKLNPDSCLRRNDLFKRTNLNNPIIQKSVLKKKESPNSSELSLISTPHSDVRRICELK